MMWPPPPPDDEIAVEEESLQTPGWSFVTGDHEARASLRAAGYRAAKKMWEEVQKRWQSSRPTKWL